jgi:phosphoribosylamine--glycine ligase
MNVLVLGSGGRENAICWKISQSSLLRSLFIAPGNGGTPRFGENINMDPTDFKAIKKFVLEKEINMVVVGPEIPLVEGIVDFFEKDKHLQKVSIIGPNKTCSQLEGSKKFAKEFMIKHGIPTAKYASFGSEQIKEAQAFIDTLKKPIVLKADGLASGKGVLILDDHKKAKDEVKAMLSGKAFGDAGTTVVIEEFLKGIECSAFIITDGASYKVLPEAKDYKRIGEGDTGLNTGGMGAISPVPFCTPEFKDKIETQIIIPTMKGLIADGLKYKGFIFFGIMKVGNEPYVIEYNCRLGDPETEAILPRLKSDLLNLFEGVATETLGECDMHIDERTAACVMLVAEGYPGEYEKGKEIKGLEDIQDSLLFHAGTKLSGKEQKLLTNGGRVMAVTSLAHRMDDAIFQSMKNANQIKYAGKYFRKDIGEDLMKFTTKN